MKSGGATNRQFAWVYFGSGTNIGLLRRSIDVGRGATNSLVYDALERVVTNTWTGSLAEHAMTLAYAYDRRNLLTNLWQAYSTGTNSVSRSYDLAGEMASESVSLDGTVMNTFNQAWDDAGRRTALATPGSTMAWTFQRQADGQLIQVNAAGRNYNFPYDSNGLLKTRSNPWRTQAIGRDGQGRILMLADTVGTVTALSESMTWRADSKLTGYTATRSGTGAWNDSRSFNYNSRDQLTTEGVGLSTGVTATDTHTYDTAGLGVHVGSVLSSGSTNNWSRTLDGFSRALVETINQGSASLTASGLAVGSASVGVALNGTTQSGVLFDPKSSDGKWRVSLTAPVGTNKVIATGTLPISGNSTTATNTFIVLAQDSVTDSYDNAGNLTTRTMTGSRTQTLKWDALGRLVKVQQVDTGGNGYTFASVYDGLGRRIRTIQTTLVNNVAVSGSTVTVDSYFDPLVEFLELGVSVNGLRTWKVYGPDLAGGYGAEQGLGGLEATIRETDGFTTGLISDVFGNTLATTTGWNQVNWTSMRVGGFGPVEGYQVPVLSPSISLAEATLWRGKRIDPTGYYHFGVRYQDPIAGRWLSPDPMGHGISLSLYDYCGNDPINGIDADGRWGKPVHNGYSAEDIFGRNAGDVNIDDLLSWGMRNPAAQIVGTDNASGWIAAGQALANGTMSNPQYIDGYTDQLGRSYMSFCYSCHDPNDPIAKLKLGAAYNTVNGSIPAFAAGIALGFVPAEGMIGAASLARTLVTEAATGAGRGLIGAVRQGGVVNPALNGAERSLQLPATDATLTGTQTLGYTTPSGDIFLQPGLSRAEQLSTLRHESVHAYFSPEGNGAVATFRQNLGQWGYDNSQMLRFAEEAMAETYASGSLLQGLRHPIVNGYGITPGGLLMEGGATAGGLFGAGYLGYKIGDGGH